MHTLVFLALVSPALAQEEPETASTPTDAATASDASSASASDAAAGGGSTAQYTPCDGGFAVAHTQPADRTSKVTITATAMACSATFTHYVDGSAKSGATPCTLSASTNGQCVFTLDGSNTVRIQTEKLDSVTTDAGVTEQQYAKYNVSW